MSDNPYSISLPGEIPDLSPNTQKGRQVKAFYEKIQFPGRRPLEQDSLIFLRKFTNLIQSRSVQNQPIRVLDAGCGTGNTSLALARQFKETEFTGLDFSSTSIARAKANAKKNGIRNVSFREWDLVQPLTGKELYDIILCFGVLHHTADLLTVLKNLYGVLKLKGSLFLWVYGQYGRYFHTLNMQALSMLMSASDSQENEIDLARAFIEKTCQGQVVKDLLGKRSEDQNLQVFKSDPTWIADQFLNPVEHLLTMKKLLQLCENSGFRLSEWIGAPKDISAVFNSESLLNCYYRLPAEQKLIVLDLVLKMERYFLILYKLKKV